MSNNYKKIMSICYNCMKGVSQKKAISNIRKSLGLGITDARILKFYIDEFHKNKKLIGKDKKDLSPDIFLEISELVERIPIYIKSHLHSCTYMNVIK